MDWRGEATTDPLFFGKKKRFDGSWIHGHRLTSVNVVYALVVMTHIAFSFIKSHNMRSIRLINGNGDHIRSFLPLFSIGCFSFDTSFLALLLIGGFSLSCWVEFMCAHMDQGLLLSRERTTTSHSPPLVHVSEFDFRPRFNLREWEWHNWHEIPLWWCVYVMQVALVLLMSAYL